MKKLVAFLLMLVMSFPLFAACNSFEAARLSIFENSLEMVMYEEYDLTVDFAGGDKSDIKWSSSNVKVATIDNGKITSLGIGSATITAEYSVIIPDYMLVESHLIPPNQRLISDSYC